MSYQPKTGTPCHCNPGAQRDNCPACEGTGQAIDFAAIRARKYVTMGRDLYNRARCRPYYSPNEYAEALAAHEGQRVEVERAWYGKTDIPYAYNLVLSGKVYHVPSIYVVEDRPS